MEEILKTKLPQLPAGMWGGVPPPKESLQITAALGQRHLACPEDPSTPMVGTSIPQQIPSLPCDSSTLRLVPHHHQVLSSALPMTCTYGGTMSLARAAAWQQNCRWEAASRVWDLRSRGSRGDTRLQR